jgi:hypothetical protein
MNATWFFLFAEHGQTDIRLDTISEKYFGMSPVVATRHAAAGTLPVRVFRAWPSRKAPWLVHLRDLSDYLDECREAGKGGPVQ